MRQNAGTDGRRRLVERVIEERGVPLRRRRRTGWRFIAHRRTGSWIAGYPLATGVSLTCARAMNADVRRRFGQLNWAARVNDDDDLRKIPRGALRRVLVTFGHRRRICSAKFDEPPAREMPLRRAKVSGNIPPAEGARRVEEIVHRALAKVETSRFIGAKQTRTGQRPLARIIRRANVSAAPGSRKLAGRVGLRSDARRGVRQQRRARHRRDQRKTVPLARRHAGDAGVNPALSQGGQSVGGRPRDGDLVRMTAFVPRPRAGYDNVRRGRGLRAPDLGASKRELECSRMLTRGVALDGGQASLTPP